MNLYFIAGLTEVGSAANNILVDQHGRTLHCYYNCIRYGLSVFIQVFYTILRYLNNTWGIQSMYDTL